MGGDYMSNVELVENIVYASPFYLDLLLPKTGWKSAIRWRGPADTTATAPM